MRHERNRKRDRETARQRNCETDVEGSVAAFCSVAASIKPKHIEMIECITPRKSSFKLFDYFFPVARRVIYISWPQFRFFYKHFPQGFMQ
jgi:hypothetical protein